MNIKFFLKKYFGYFLRYSPIFHMSSDDNFGTFNAEMKFRISLLSISLGSFKFYFISFSDSKLEPFKILPLSRFLKTSNYDEIKQKVEKYEALITSEPFLKKNDEDSLNRQIQYLNRKIGENNHTNETIHNKVNGYIPICIAYLTFIVYLITTLLSIWNQAFTPHKFVAVACFTVSIYCFINTALLLHFYLNVKAFISSTFRDLKEDTKLTALASASYCDWMASKYKHEGNATILRNIEKYFYPSVLWGILTWIGLLLMADQNSSQSYAYENRTNSSQAIEVIDCQGVVNINHIVNATSVLKSSHTASIIYSKDDVIAKKVINFLSIFSNNRSDQILYEIDRKGSKCDSMIILIKGKQ